MRIGTQIELACALSPKTTPPLVEVEEWTGVYGIAGKEELVAIFETKWTVKLICRNVGRDLEIFMLAFASLPSSTPPA